jgi:hypothetical protein
MPRRPPTPDAGYAPVGDDRAAWETRDVSLVRYVCRRTAKTRLLLGLAEHLPADGLGQPDLALATFGAFCAAAAASHGHGYRQPWFDAAGAEAAERDPETGAAIVARLVTRGPGSRFGLTVRADVPGIATIEASEEITGTTIGLHGLGMPAPSRFALRTIEPLASWSATATGTITAELAPSWRGTLVRGHGTLELADDRGARGMVTLGRDGRIQARAGSGASVELSIARTAAPGVRLPGRR